MIFMNQMRGVIRHTHPWMDAGSYQGTPRLTMATFQKAFSFIYLFLSDCEITAASNFTALGDE